MTARLLAAWLLLPCQFVLIVTGCSGDTNDHSSASACNGIVFDASGQRSVLQSNAPRACDGDEDCVVVDYPLSCVNSCRLFSAVARTTEAELASSVQNIDDMVCTDFFARGCMLPVKGCASGDPPVATCDDGVCTLHAAP
jgi:hypothetical protein